MVERQGIRPQYGKMEPGDRRDIFHHMALMCFSTSFCHHSEPLEFLGGWSYQKEKASPRSLALGYGFPLMDFSKPGLSLSQKPKDRRCSLSTWKTLRSESSRCEAHAALPCS